MRGYLTPLPQYAIIERRFETEDLTLRSSNQKVRTSRVKLSVSLTVVSGGFPRSVQANVASNRPRPLPNALQLGNEEHLHVSFGTK